MARRAKLSRYGAEQLPLLRLGDTAYAAHHHFKAGFEYGRKGAARRPQEEYKKTEESFWRYL